MDLAGEIMGFLMLGGLVCWGLSSNIQRLIKVRDEIRSENLKLAEKLNSNKAVEAKVERDRQSQQEWSARDRMAIEAMSREKSLGFPWLADAYADYYRLKEMQIADSMEHKRPPAKRSADELRRISHEKAVAVREGRIHKYLIDYYERLFPWLMEFRGEDVDDLVRTVGFDIPDDSEPQEEEDPARRWLSDSEYMALTDAEKCQKALDRYLASRKTPWEKGREYERYIGFLYEMKGFRVEYRGALEGYRDFGRDLVCRKGGRVEIVQCKYWSRWIVREPHINQLFGTACMFWLESEGKSLAQVPLLPGSWAQSGVTATLITSSTISEEARMFSNVLSVRVLENVPLEPYPCIKCNISQKDGTRIYHLPFDQQYDSTIIDRSRGELYAFTVLEAEALGFRRAFRWRGSETKVD